MGHSFTSNVRPIVRRLLIGSACLLLATCTGGELEFFGSSKDPPPADWIAPTVPTGLRAWATSPWTIELAWNPSTDVGSGVAVYEIKRISPNTVSAYTTETRITDTHLIAGTEYCYVVRAGDKYGNRSSYSEPACAVTLGTAIDTVVATSIGVLPDGRIQVAYALAPSIWHDRKVQTVVVGTGATPGVAPPDDPILDSPLTVTDEEAFVVVRVPESTSLREYAVPDLSGRWLGAVPSDAVLAGRHADVVETPEGLHAVFPYSAWYQRSLLGYARWGPDNEPLGSWAVMRLADSASFPSLALESGGTTHIVTGDAGNGGVVHTWDTPDGREFEEVPFGGPVDPDADVAVDAAGDVYVCAYDPVSKDLLLARKASGTWTVERIDEAGDVGRHASIVAVAPGVLHLAYADSDRRVLRHATNASGAWVTTDP